RAHIKFDVSVPKPAETVPPDPSAPAPQGTPLPTITLDPETQIGGCDVSLVDTEGRIYTDDPGDIVDGGDDVQTYGCLATGDDPLHYIVSFYFALPASSHPEAIRVSSATLPHYVRLTLDGHRGHMAIGAGTAGYPVDGGGHDARHHDEDDG